jgi:hypothetical protein
MTNFGGKRKGGFGSALRASGHRGYRCFLQEAMMASFDPLARLDAQISDVSDVYVGAGQDAESYIAGLEQALREAVCAPFLVTAKVDEPGFPDANVGDTITGQCVAHSEGYWLIYQSEKDRFMCFWGADVDSLGAPGIFGSPLGCWSA